MSEGRRQWMGQAALTLASLLIGMAIGLFIGWETRPTQPTSANPADLRSSDKDDYIRMISAAYSLNGDMNAAKERLAQLGIADPVLVAGAVATREIGPGSNRPGDEAVLKFVAALATADRPTPSSTSTATASLTNTPVEAVSPSPTPSLVPSQTAEASPSYTVTATDIPTETATAEPTSTATLDPSLTFTEQPTATATLEPTFTLTVSSSDTPVATETTLPTASATAAATATQPPTATLTPVPTVPLPTATFTPTPLPTLPPVASPTQPPPGFQLVGRTMLTCVDNPDVGYLRFYVRDQSGRALPNVAIEVRWSSGDDIVYTGLKPERGVGYADFEAAPDTYAVAIANGGSDTVTGLVVAASPANCTLDRGVTPRGWKLTFQQK